MLIPQHIWNYIRRIESELFRNYRMTGREDVKEALNKVIECEDGLSGYQILTSVKAENNKIILFNIFRLLNEINLQRYLAGYPSLATCEVIMEYEFVLALDKAMLTGNKELRVEARTLHYLLKNKCEAKNLSSYDLKADYREYKFVPTAQDWENIFKKYPEACNKTNYAFEKIKIAYLKTESTLDERIHLLGYRDLQEFKDEYHDLQEYENIARKWLRTGIAYTYYIYIPKI